MWFTCQSKAATVPTVALSPKKNNPPPSSATIIDADNDQLRQWHEDEDDGMEQTGSINLFRTQAKLVNTSMKRSFKPIHPQYYLSDFETTLRI